VPNRRRNPCCGERTLTKLREAIEITVNGVRRSSTRFDRFAVDDGVELEIVRPHHVRASASTGGMEDIPPVCADRGRAPGRLLRPPPVDLLLVDLTVLVVAQRPPRPPGTDGRGAGGRTPATRSSFRSQDRPAMLFIVPSSPSLGHETPNLLDSFAGNTPRRSPADWRVAQPGSLAARTGLLDLLPQT
jgi:hypothetical protein